MTDRRILVLAHSEARQRAVAAVQSAPAGYVVQIGPATKKRIQEEKYHAMIDEIAKQSTYAGKSWHREDMKRILVDEFADAMRVAGTPIRHDGRLIPSENGRRVIQLGIQTRDFLVDEASEFIEFLTCWGAERGVEFAEPVAA